MILNSEIVVQLIASLVTIIAVLALLIKQFLPNKKSNNPTKYDLSDFVNDSTKDHTIMIEQQKATLETLKRIEAKLG